jgi:DNA-binding transcriptional ArsR family regulator
MAYSYLVTPGSTLEVIAEPSRRRILDQLLKGERSVNALVAELAMAQPAVSKHLRVLRQAGLVTVRQDGPRRLYRVRAAPLMELDEWLDPYRRMWRDSLDRLEAHLARPDRVSRRTSLPGRQRGRK